MFARWAIQVTSKIEALEGDLFDLKEENKTLKEIIDKLEKEKEVERENIVSAKVRSVENDQFARRYNIVVFGIAESRNDTAETKIKEIIKEKLKINLKPDAIEICHRLGEKTLNKIRPVIVQACWSWNGKIVAKDLKGKIKSVRYDSNRQSLLHAPSDQESMTEEVPEGDCVHCLTH